MQDFLDNFDGYQGDIPIEPNKNSLYEIISLS